MPDIPETEEANEHSSHQDLFTVDPSLNTRGGKRVKVEYLG